MSATCPTCGEPFPTREGDDRACPHCRAAPTPLHPEQPTLSPPSPDEAATIPPSPAAGSAVPARSVPGYELLDELGRGGMGVVYKARQTALGRIVALKMILSGGHAAQAEMQRFQTEAESIARLQHPNIVQVFEVGQHEGLPFLSLEYCAGGSLDRKLAGTPIDPREAAKLVKALAEAMQAAHDANVIHRDLKPANVLLAADGTPKITDFGLAKKLDAAGQTQTGAVMGTPSYMAPEQADAKKDVSPAADIYALGAILYECLTGRPPFKAATAIDTLMQLLHEEPAPPRSLVPNLPRDLETITLKCLEKLPARRYESAQALADDLGRFLADESIEARRPGLAERAWRRARKQGRQAIVTAAVGAAMVVVALAALFGLGVYSDSLMGELELTTDGPVLTAEVLRDDGLVTRFRVPTVDPVRLDPGAYRLRLSAPGWPSEEANLLITQGGKHSFDADILPREMWPAVAGTGFSPSSVRYRPIPLYLPDRIDLVLVRDQHVARVHGKTGQESRLALPPNVTTPRHIPWPEEFRHDIDGDGLADVVVVGNAGTIYRLDEKVPAQEVASVQAPYRALVGHLPAGRRADLVVACFRQSGETWLERVGEKGAAVWKADLPRGSWPAGSPPPRVTAGKAQGRDVLVAAFSSLAVVLNPATGKPLGPMHERPGQRSYAAVPHLVDLDGDGQPEVVWTPPETHATGHTLTAFSPATGKVLWQRVNLPRLLGFVSGGAGVDVLAQTASPDRGWMGVERLDGREGQPRWRAQIAKNLSGESIRIRALAGPDLDGDGEPEVFTAHLRPALRDAQPPSLHLHALSGATGKTLWHRRIVGPWVGELGGLHFWPGGPGGRPRLVVPTEQSAARAILVLDGGDGRLLHRIPDARQPAVLDLDGDGLPDLCYQTSQSSTARGQGEFTLRTDPLGPSASPPTQELLRVIRGVPPAEWRWMGRWEAIHDLDGKGVAEILRRERDGALAVASGETGRLLWPWGRIEGIGAGPPEARPAAANSVLSLPPGAGDLDGDGVPDLLALDAVRKSYLAPSPGQLVFPLRAVDGATGEERWMSGSAGIDGIMTVNTQRQPITVTSPPVWLSDGQESWIAVRTRCNWRSRPGASPAERYFLALLSGDGKARWANPLPDTSQSNDAVWDIASTPRVALAGPPGRRVLLHLGRTPRPTAGASLLFEAYRVADGTTAWQKPFDGHGSGSTPLGFAIVPGERELAVLRVKDTLTAYDTSTSQEIWQHTPTLPNTPTVAEWTPPVVLPRAGAGPLIIYATSRGRPRRLVALDAGGKLVAERELDSAQAYRLAVADLGGSPALVVSSPASIRVQRGGIEPRHDVWSWNPPVDFGAAHPELSRPPGGPVTVIVRTRLGNVIGLDAATGKEKWRAPQEGAELVELLGAGDRPSLVFGWPGKQTVRRAALALDPQGRYVLPTAEPRTYDPPRDDPRSVRGLPWVERGLKLDRQRGLLLALAPVVTLAGLVMPCWLFYTAARRASWRRLLAWVVWTVGVALAVLAIGPEVGMRFGWSDARFDSLGLWMSVLGTALLGLPVLALLWTVGAALVRRRWRRLAWLAGLWLGCCVALAGVWLYFDSGSLDDEQRYSWGQWYGVWWLGLFLASVLLAAGWVSWALAQVIRGKRRKKKPAPQPAT